MEDTVSVPPSVPAAGAGLPARSSALDGPLRMVLDVSRMLAVPTELDPLLCRIAEICTEMLGCERASLFLHDASTNDLWTKVALKTTKEIRVPCHAGIVGHAYRHNELVHVPEPYSDPRFNPEPDRSSGFVTRNLISCPVLDLDGKPLGVIQAVNKIEAGFTANDLEMIQLLADQSGVAIQRHHLQQTAAEAAALRHEMDLARRIQQSLIPKAPPGVPGLDAVGWTVAASTTGGDCFDLWRLPDGRLGVLVADASGHGLGPAMIVSQTRTLVRAFSDIGMTAHELLARVNTRLVEDLDWGYFVTAFLGFLSPDGELDWTSAGHGPVFLRPGGDESLQQLDTPVQPLGVLENWFDDAPAPLFLGPGGALFITSDGIFEAPNPVGEQLGIARMLKVFEDTKNRPAADVIAGLRDTTDHWLAGRDLMDDQTIVVVKREQLGPSRPVY